MHRTCLIAAASLLIAGGAYAESNWKGDGWYQVVEYVSAGRDSYKSIYKGPYADEAGCLRELHPDYTSPGVDDEDPDTLKDFSCVRLSSRPDWDQ